MVGPHRRHNKSPELRQVVTLTVTGTDDSHPNLSVINQFSTFRKLRRIIALCLRFADLCKKRITKNDYNHPSTAELQNAEEKIILLVQKANFEHEIRDLKAGRQVNSKSKLKLLNPFIDNSGMIRVENDCPIHNTHTTKNIRLFCQRVT
jgi:hypothetical protein